MKHVVIQDGRKKMKTYSSLQNILLFSIFFLILIFPSVVRSWSSLDQTGLRGSFGTHEFLCDRAYDELEKHPAFEYIHFPSQEKIREYSGINFAKEGKGPDNPKLTRYSEHYYNPRNGQGLAPKSVEREYNDLKNSLRALMIAGGDPGTATKEKTSIIFETAARSAAWSGHFIQDMTCSFHVNGMMRDEVNVNNVPSEQEFFEIMGPYSQSMNEPWAELVRRFREDEDGNSDWFDPVYFDGPDYEPSRLSTHFTYEGAVETNCGLDQAALINTTDMVESYLTKDRISREWKHDMSMDELAIRLATNTKDLLDNDTMGYLYIDPNMVRTKIDRVRFYMDLI